jgi:protease-4
MSAEPISRKDEEKMSNTPDPSPQPKRASSSPAPATYPVTATMPAQIVISSGRRGRFARIMSWLGWMLIGFCVLSMIGMAFGMSEYFDTSEGITEKYHSLSELGTDKIAVIKVTGTIMGGDGYVKKQINRVRKDESVKGIVLRVNSPGGTVTGSDFIYHHLTKLRDERELPMVVSMGAMAASGGYYVAMAVGDQENSIYAEPTTTTGSIGVIIPHYDLTGLMERFDIKNDSIATHPRKMMLSMTKKSTPEDRAVLERYVNSSFERFKGIVKAGRPRFRDNPEELDELATGEIFTAEQAQEAGLVDEIGFIEEAIERVIELADLDEDKVRVVTYRQPVSFVEALGLSQSERVSPGAELANLSVPRAYYLLTSLPILLSNE